MNNEHGERDFHHPYNPYDIQLDFMNAVYDCIESGNVGIFESPTGTGKSLSLICGSLTWLRDHTRRHFQEGSTTSTETSSEPPWMLEHARNQEIQRALDRKADLDVRLAKIKAKEKQIKERDRVRSQLFKKQKLAADDAYGHGDEAQYVLDDYESDEDAPRPSKSTIFSESGLSSETQALMAKLGYSTNTNIPEDQSLMNQTKIFFCSRTHSQLTQFSSEIRRVKLPPAIPLASALKDLSENALVEDVKYLTLGSRKNLCINEKVNRLGNATAINERCVELQQSTVVTSRCPHMPNKESEALVNDFRDYALAKVRDIEDLGSLGKKLGVCPYYASRPAIQYCEVSKI